MGGDVKFLLLQLHMALSAKIQEDTKLLSEGTGTVVGSSTTTGTATTAPDTQIEVEEDPARAFVF